VKNPFAALVQFVGGASLFLYGLYLFFTQLIVSSPYRGYRYARGAGGAGDWFAVLIIPLLIGFFLIFANKLKSLGYYLVLFCVAGIAVGLVMKGMFFSFRPVSLWNLLLMLAMIGGGGGMAIGSLSESETKDQKQIKTTAKR